jgi:uncharacterized protein with PQ loop repeat
MDVCHEVEILVLVVGLFGWAISIPQLRLLLQTKDSRSNSLIVYAGGSVSQTIFLINSLLHQNWVLAFSMGMGLFTSVVTICFIVYYRAYPGGKVKSKQTIPRGSLRGFSFYTRRVLWV